MSEPPRRTPPEYQISGEDPVDTGGPEALGPAAALFHALSEPARLSVLSHLALGEHSVKELTDHLGLAQSTVSAHLRCLMGCGLLQMRTVGRSSRYSLALSEETFAILAAAERLLLATGDAVVLCPTRAPAVVSHPDGSA